MQIFYHYILLWFQCTHWLKVLLFFMMKASKLSTVVTKITIRTYRTVKCWMIFWIAIKTFHKNYLPTPSIYLKFATDVQHLKDRYASTFPNIAEEIQSWTRMAWIIIEIVTNTVSSPLRMIRSHYTQILWFQSTIFSFSGSSFYFAHDNSDILPLPKFPQLLL